MKEYSYLENEKILKITVSIIFVSLILVLTLLGVYPIFQSIIESIMYVVPVIGLLISIESIKKIGVFNFAGKSFLYLGIASLLAIINIILFNFGYLFINSSDLFLINKGIWIIQAIMLTLGTSSLLTTYKLRFPRYFYLEALAIFIISLFFFSFFSGWPQILNSILITSALMSVRISGKKTHSGIIFLSIGLILLALSNSIFVYRTGLNISYFGDLSDLILSISWVIITIGIYYTKKYHVC